MKTKKKTKKKYYYYYYAAAAVATANTTIALNDHMVMAIIIAMITIILRTQGVSKSSIDTSTKAS